MAESSHPPSRVRLRNGGGGGGGGEIVEVQGGHIVRSTGRKDRHSKVCTAKGPRDRRVRLAAHTAIQFYDVQDRLGYDRPSKAVDWLIKKAKSSIDELAQLPPWHPTNCSAPPPNNSSFEQHEAAAAAAELDHNHHQLGLQHDDLMINSVSGASSKRSMAAMLGGGEDRGQSSSFLPPSLDSDAIADTIKSFFPMGASAVASSCSAAMQQQQFHSFPTPDFLQSRNTSHSQDLKLSLHSFQDPILLHHHHNQQNPTHHNTEQTNQEQHIQGHVLLSGIPLGFDGTSGWGAEHHHQQAAELSRFHRQQSWNSGGGGGGGDSGNYLFNSPSQPMLQQLLGQNQNQNQNQFVSQRGPLQSSNTPSIRAWMDPSATAISTTSTTTSSDQHYHHHLPIYPLGFGSGIGSFSGFNIPARIQGDQEVHDGYPDKPSSASSDSRH
ncbi:hypothetical protein ABFS82_13G068400 [Erythranthe guttata]|uniref:TCP domain-containing protein n=1 Tax=Erythranthe guttata TaxID=4155 RepID=A0A022RYC6_ERYGU|nr:PREDICTED: transcription factor TCP4-like [Erythranthe guttata]EYU45001.1 hypothetical protein MIMGU_mgv1a006656mg [Erythranthe guttata]|eukprot:XP_012848057.1 PREDICTED: transcription factor TCP4-like [Erythranthe guttata]